MLLCQTVAFTTVGQMQNGHFEPKLQPSCTFWVTSTFFWQCSHDRNAYQINYRSLSQTGFEGKFIFFQFENLGRFQMGFFKSKWQTPCVISSTDYWRYFCGSGLCGNWPNLRLLSHICSVKLVLGADFFSPLCECCPDGRHLLSFCASFLKIYIFSSVLGGGNFQIWSQWNKIFWTHLGLKWLTFPASPHGTQTKFRSYFFPPN